MLDTVWRLGEKDFDVDAFLVKFGLKELAVVFHEGEKRGQSKVQDSGFNILISENINSLENINDINQFMAKHKEAFDYLAKLNIHSVLDIGCTVASNQFTKSVNISSKLLGALSLLNVSLELSVYPAPVDE